MAAGLASEQGDTPESRDGKIKAEFPWGGEWPPPAGSGNFADQTARRQLGAVIAGFNDGHGTSAPVGSFAANRFGLFDIAGNLWEWCADSYKGTAGRQDWGVLRGGSWSNATRAELLSSYRNVIDRNERDVIFGFRCVLVPGGEGRQTDVENGADAHPSPATKVAP
jgi:formylglycine-generating enzyme required for sulfatase activity